MRIPLRRAAPDAGSYQDWIGNDGSGGGPFGAVRPNGSSSELGDFGGEECLHGAGLEEGILRLARRTSRLRFLRGRLARVLLARKGWSPLGFVRLGDYSRERLGLAGRTLEEEARVAWVLDRLPRTTRAFLESQLSWTQVRLITAVAGTGTEATWIETARSCSTRQLEKKVRDARVRPSSQRDQAEAPFPGASSWPEDAEDDTSRFSVRISREGRRLWRVACEMAERSEGSVLTQAQVLERVVAEAASGAPRGGGNDEPPFDGGSRQSSAGRSDHVPDADRAGRSDGMAHPGESDGMANEARADGGESDVRGEVPRPAAPRERPCASGAAALDPANFRDHDPELAALLESLLSDEADEAYAAPHVAVEPLGDLVDRHLAAIVESEGLPSALLPGRGSSPDERLEALFRRCESNDPFFLDARMREIGLAMQRVDAQVGRLLLQALERRLYRELGFTTFSDFVGERLDFCPRKAWTLVAIERATSRCCGAFAVAYREGRLSLLAARALLPVMGSRHGEAWIERAQLVTLRRLEAEVTWALDRRDAAADPAAADAAPPPSDCDLGGQVSDLMDREGLRERAQGAAATADAGVAAAAATTAATGDGTGGGTGGGTGQAGRVQMRAPVDLHFFVPSEVAALAEETMRALRRGSESRGAAFERMVATALLEWTAAPGHRDPVFERDGWRCAVPACRSRRNLHDHHILFRSRGGDNGRDNRVSVCAAHHLHGLHWGRIRARGRAPSEILWELGCRQAFAEPLARLLGDRYLARL